MVRKTFENKLEELNTKLVRMGNMSKEALEKSVAALKEQNVDRSVEVIDKDYRINRLEEELNNEAIWLIAKEQPVATDLRRLVTILKVSSDLERIGDLAVNIAKSTIRIGEKELFKPLEDIPQMAEKVIGMTADVLDTFQSEDIVTAKEIADKDDEVDKMHGKLIQELLQYMSRDPNLISQVTQLAFVCRDLERVGDHITNISESIIYLVKGKQFDLNS
ncbi:phosphate signaling complex protein PhoU [Virgibacillus sediminis]|uniref:Phosphate-specific transport system accessory protein PhoU n=1 Tax=Virgibacillus sediminis TaxID=202260 RepID=A0ABV7A124_9BACI